MGEACGAPTEAPTEAAEDVDGKPEKSGVSSHSPTEKIGIRLVPTAMGKRGQWPWRKEMGSHSGWLGC